MKLGDMERIVAISEISTLKSQWASYANPLERVIESLQNKKSLEEYLEEGYSVEEFSKSAFEGWDCSDGFTSHDLAPAVTAILGADNEQFQELHCSVIDWVQSYVEDIEEEILLEWKDRESLEALIELVKKWVPADSNEWLSIVINAYTEGEIEGAVEYNIPEFVSFIDGEWKPVNKPS